MVSSTDFLQGPFSHDPVFGAVPVTTASGRQTSLLMDCDNHCPNDTCDSDAINAFNCIDVFDDDGDGYSRTVTCVP